ncbi:cation channel sperm-associated auxiliary subunit epsilon [Rhynchonycteris naso]
MSVQGLAMLLSCLSCCGSALWRYSTSSTNYRIFSTRSSIKLEYEGTVFSEWSVPATCTVNNKSSPVTKLRCSSPGIQIIKPIVTGPVEEEVRYLAVGNSNTCFLWHYKVINYSHNLTQIIIIWVYDPENADPNELAWQANEPSLNSIILSKQLAAMGQKPTIYTYLKRKIYYPQTKMKNGAWYISIPMAADDLLKEIKGNLVAFQDCFIADFLFLLTVPLPTIPETPGSLPISSPPGSQLISDWDVCLPTFAVVVADTETFQTNNSFRTWTRIRVPPNILTDEERRNVSGGKRSEMAIWTRNKIYLGYASLKFTKIMTIQNLRKILNISPAATTNIHNVVYTAYPLELAVLLDYCVTCDVIKNIHLVIYNEETKQWVYKDFALAITPNSFITPYFLLTAMPELILWDKHRVYYCYNNFTSTGVIQTPTGSGNLSKLSHDSVIHEVFADYLGHILVKMENNIMFYFKNNIRDAVRLSLWTNSATKLFMLLNISAQIYLVSVFQNDTIHTQAYPLNLEVQSITFKRNEKCPFVTLHDNIIHVFYILDKGQNLSVWVQLVYPENIGLYIIVESYGPKILEVHHHLEYEVALGFCTKTITLTFFQNVNYEAVDDYFQLQHQQTGLMLVQVSPSEYSKACPMAPKVLQLAVGCDPDKYIAVKGFNKTNCLQHDFTYIIEKSYLRNEPSENLRVNYIWKKYGCPMRLDFREKFHPLIQLYDENGFVEDVEVNFIVWEIHGRADYSFNSTMKKSGCLNEAQSWKSMSALNKHLPLGKVWGPENYKNCFSYAIGKPGDLNQPYEIINKSNYNHLVWPMDHTGMYVFRVKILDPNYSFCNLTALFAIETYGLIPSPNGYLVFSVLFLLMLLFFTLLVLSYFHYMRIYKQYIFNPIHKTERKQKNT